MCSVHMSESSSVLCVVCHSEGHNQCVSGMMSIISECNIHTFSIELAFLVLELFGNVFVNLS